MARPTSSEFRDPRKRFPHLENFLTSATEGLYRGGMIRQAVLYWMKVG